MTETFLIDQSLYKLKELFLDSNDLEAFIISRPLQNLRVISIKNNKLQVFKGLDKYCNERLEEVNFEGNELNYISGVKESYNSIKNLINLKKLNLSHNTIKQFQASQDQLIFPKLDFINLRKNRLKSYHFLSNA